MLSKVNLSLVLATLFVVVYCLPFQTNNPDSLFSNVEDAIRSGKLTDDQIEMIVKLSLERTSDSFKSYIAAEHWHFLSFHEHLILLNDRYGSFLVYSGLLICSLVIIHSFLKITYRSLVRLVFFLETPRAGPVAAAASMVTLTSEATEINVDFDSDNDSLSELQIRLHSPPAQQAYVGESVKPDSKILRAGREPCQVFISDGEIQISSGFRYGEMLITTHHTISGLDKIYVKGGTDGVLEINTNKFQFHAHADVAFCYVSPQDWSAIGVSKGTSIKTYIPNSMVSVSSFNGSSTGQLRTSDYMLHYYYSGSTLEGFSGAPYMQNKRVAGMHLGAGSLNLGILIFSIDFVILRPDCLPPTPIYAGEKNRKTKPNRTVDDDTYLNYLKSNNARNGKKVRASYFNGHNDDHGYMVQGSNGRIVFTEQYEDFYEIVKPTETYAREAVSFSNSSIPQFTDLDPKPTTSFLVKRAPVSVRS